MFSVLRDYAMIKGDTHLIEVWKGKYEHRSRKIYTCFR